ncbi:MAG: glycosyltransferase family 2 protein [Eubacteriales bacterium]|nr:glycosyltransferase family 2 protein [Eubacteriales bacterium]
MKKTPLVSVLIPTYKSTSSLKMSVESVLSQTYENYEIIVIDDNNPDTEYRRRTEAIMDRYIHNPKIMYIKHSKNKNGAAARNTGFKNSKGELICLYMEIPKGQDYWVF